MNDTITRGRRAKHIDHYVGPGIITKHLGTRSIVIRYKEKDFQRDVGMIMLEKPGTMDIDPTIKDRLINEPRLQMEAIRNDIPYREGEFVILKDDPNAETWYCAECRGQENTCRQDRSQLLHNCHTGIARLQ